MKVNVFARFVAVISLLFSMHSIALPELDPYRGLVLVEDDQSEELLRERALKQVLIRVSGNTSITQLEESNALIKKIPSMLAQFGYQQGSDGGRYYYAQFDKRKINQALESMQQPVWGTTRPNTLVWLVENGSIVSEYQVKSSADPSISWGLKKAELKRGINAQFPLLDLDDSMAINATDISGRFYQITNQATLRYDSEYYVLASLNKTYDGKWQLDWELIQGSANSQIKPVVLKESNRGSKSYVMSAMVNSVADYYARQFAILVNDGEKLTQMVNIDGIDSLQELTRLHQLLNNLNAVESFEMTKIDKHQVDVLITLRGSLASLSNALDAQVRLQADPTSVQAFQFFWTP